MGRKPQPRKTYRAEVGLINKLIEVINVDTDHAVDWVVSVSNHLDQAILLLLNPKLKVESKANRRS